MGLSVAREVRNAPISLTYQEANELLKIFKSFDKDKDGHISIHDLRKALTEMGETVSDDELRELIAEVDINKNCTIEEEEFLQVHMSVSLCILSQLLKMCIEEEIVHLCHVGPWSYPTHNVAHQATPSFSLFSCNI